MLIMRIAKAELMDNILSHPGIVRGLNGTPGYGAVILSE